MNMPCPNCGKPIDVDDRFCSNCGFNLSDIGTQKSKTNGKMKIESQYDKKITAENFPSDVYVPDRGIWQKFFRVSGRLNSARFLFRSTLVYTVAFALALIASVLPLPKSAVEVTMALIFLMSAVISFPLMIRRAHDFGRPWWYCFVAGIPILAGFFEFVFQKVVYRDRYGDYHETHRFNEAGATFSFFYIIIAATLASLYFVFRSGDPGENEYGANPVGNKRADIPVEDNPILATMSKIEESEHSSVMIIGSIVGMFFATGIIFQALSSVMNTQDQKAVAQNTVVNNSQSSVENIPKPVLPRINEDGSVSKVPSEQIQTEQKKNPSNNSSNVQSELLSKPLTNDNQKKAVETLVNFHRGITQKNYRLAYEQLSSDYQYHMDYDGWASGFVTTVSSSVSRVNVVGENSSEIFLNYILTAVDNVQGQEKVARFNGTVKIINENGVWRIDEISNKVL